VADGAFSLAWPEINANMSSIIGMSPLLPVGQVLLNVLVTFL
jgi:hypothetical protein